MHEKPLRTLLDVLPTARLDPLVCDLVTTLLHAQDLLSDPRIRRLELERSNPVGSWVVTSAMAFETLDGTPRTFKPVPSPPRHHGGTTDGSKEHRKGSAP